MDDPNSAVLADLRSRLAKRGGAAYTGPANTSAEDSRTEHKRAEQEHRKGPTAWDSALRLLGARARSRHEMRDRLQRKGFDVDTIDDVMERLVAGGLLDDEDFAHEWVRSRSQNSARGRRALRQELSTKGVASETVEAALAEIDPEDERAIAADLVDRKLTPSILEQAQADRMGREKALRKLVGMLVRRGYSQSMALDLVNERLRGRTAS